MVLPAGTQLPPPLYGVTILGAAALVGAGLRRACLSAPVVAALGPWMATGAGLYVLTQVGAVPGWLAPALSSPTVYLTTFVLAGAVWLAADRTDTPVPAALLGSGTLATVAVWGIGVDHGLAAGTWRPGPSVVAAALAAALAAAVWGTLRRVRPEDAGTTAEAGALVVVGHAVDAVSTAVGVDWLGFGERTPLSALILEVGATLPTAPYIGAGWLFVVVKLGLAAGVVVLLAEYVRERPREGMALLAVVAAVGLGPGTHNLLLFAVSGG